MNELRCIICGQEVTHRTPGGDQPEHYHVSCAAEAKGLTVVWNGKVLQHSDEDLSWVRDKSEEDGEYYGVTFDDERGYFSATIVVHGVESEGEGATALSAIEAAYDDLQQETLRIAAKVWELGNPKVL